MPTPPKRSRASAFPVFCLVSFSLCRKCTRERLLRYLRFYKSGNGPSTWPRPSVSRRKAQRRLLILRSFFLAAGIFTVANRVRPPDSPKKRANQFGTVMGWLCDGRFNSLGVNHTRRPGALFADARVLGQPKRIWYRFVSSAFAITAKTRKRYTVRQAKMRTDPAIFSFV